MNLNVSFLFIFLNYRHAYEIYNDKIVCLQKQRYILIHMRLYWKIHGLTYILMSKPMTKYQKISLKSILVSTEYFLPYPGILLRRLDEMPSYFDGQKYIIQLFSSYRVSILYFVTYRYSPIFIITFRKFIHTKTVE